MAPMSSSRRERAGLRCVRRRRRTHARSKASDTDENVHPAFGGTKYVVPGTRNQGLEIGGFLDTTTPGRRRCARPSRRASPIRIQVLFDGVNGFDQSCACERSRTTADAEGDLQPITFSVVGNAAATIVGAGPVW
jgi:hypothetical protein